MYAYHIPYNKITLFIHVLSMLVEYMHESIVYLYLEVCGKYRKIIVFALERTRVQLSTNSNDPTLDLFD